MPFKVHRSVKLCTRLLSDREADLSFRLIDSKKSRDVLTEIAAGQNCGVYVFALKKQGGGAAHPWYVGKTEKNSLAFEALLRDKLRKYATALIDNSGSPVLYFITPENGYEHPKIDPLETFLIWLARQRNPRLLNRQKVRLTPYSLQKFLTGLSIHGV